MENQNLSEFDEIGAKPDSAPSSQNPASSAEDSSKKEEVAADISPNSRKTVQTHPPSPKKMVFGCLVFFFALFAILIVAMIFGMRAGEETIIGFGLNPVSFKNWTIGMVSVLFGSLALAAVISIVYHIGERLLTSKDNLIAKAKAGMKGLFSGIIFIVVLVIWFMVYNYISKFEMKPPELPIEIVTNPTYTYELTSPIQVEFSAERITDKFKKTYDLVSYEWDKEGDGQVDTTGQKVTIYFPHGGKNNGVYDVRLLVKMQPKGGGDTISKEYSKTVSISKQELYGEIEVDRESGEVPLTVKFDADKIADPDGSQITSYAWDLDGDGRPDRDGFIYRNTEWTFETIGEHTVSLTVTSDDFFEDGAHESKTFKKTIVVHEPADSVDTEIWIEASPKKGFSPMTVNFDAKQKASNKKSSRISKYEWKIGDGLEVLRGQHTRFVFDKPGVYPVELIATFSNGQVKRDMVEIIVNDESIAPEAVIKTEPEKSNQYKAVVGSAPLVVKFDANDSEDADDNIVKYDWDFDNDGQWDAEGSVIEHKFQDPGDYKTILRLTDADGNESRAELSIKVGDEIAIVDFGVNKLAGAAPLTIDFDASGSRAPSGKEITSYEWDFNPNIKSSSKQTFIYERAQTSHIFDKVGEHFVKLTIHADDGSEYFDILKVVATYPSLNAEFSASRVSGNAPLGVSFDADASSGNISKYEWIFNDGQTSSEQSLTHIFENPGTYEVVLKVYDSLNNVSQSKKIISVN
jgi:PKD repeat protein